MAKLGSWGRQPNNIHGQLQNLHGEPYAPTPKAYRVEVKQEKLGATDSSETMTEEVGFPIVFHVFNGITLSVHLTVSNDRLTSNLDFHRFRVSQNVNKTISVSNNNL